MIGFGESGCDTASDCATTGAECITNTCMCPSTHFYNGQLCEESKCFSLHCVCVEVLMPNQPNEVMLSAVSLPNHTFTGQA